MAIRSDDKRRWVEMTARLPGTPEDVFRALATGAGMTAWFTPTTVEERTGGAIVFDMGGGAVSRGVITDWDPAHYRLVYEEREWNAAAPPVATEIIVTARSGHTCTVRMVHSLFTSSDEWDNELEGFERGWPVFFAVLHYYLQHFVNQPAASAWASAMTQLPMQRVWRTLSNRLGLGGALVGDRWKAPADAPAFAGTVAHVQFEQDQSGVMIHLVEPMPGVLLLGAYRMGGITRIGANAFLYGEASRGAADQARDAWGAWLTSVASP